MFPFPSLDLALGIIADWRLAALFIACGGRGRSGIFVASRQIHRIPHKGPHKALQYYDDSPPLIAATFLLSPPFQFCNSPQCKRLISASSCYKLAIVYPTSHVWFSVKVDGGWRGRGKGETYLYFPALTPLLTFDLRTPPWYKFISLPSLPLSLKLKMAAIIFVMKLLSTRSPKLRQLSRLIL